MNSTPQQVLSDLGALHRASIWENITLNVGLASKGIEVPSTPALSPEEGSPNPNAPNAPTTDGQIAASAPSATNGVQSDNGPTSSSILTGGNTKSENARDWNASSLRHLTQGLPNALNPFFQGNSMVPINP